MRLSTQKNVSFSPLLRPTSRIWTWIGLALIMVCYTAVCCFWHYITRGQWFDFSMESYRYSFFRPIGYALLEPLSIFCNPWMIAVIGPMLGAVMFAPASLAIMYRMPVCLLAVAISFFVGHMPMLSVAMLIGCLLVCLTRFRHEIHLLALTLAFLPMGLYLYFFACMGVDSGGVAAIQRWLLGVPLLSGFVLAVMMSVGASLLGRIDFLRPFIIIPLLLGLTIPAVTFFYKKIGNDKLQYAVLVQGLAQPDELFPPMTVAEWKSRPGSLGLSSQAMAQSIRDDLENRESGLGDQCRRFLADNSRSKLRSAVMWLDAQRASLQVDLGQLRNGEIKYTAQWVVPESAQTWQGLAKEYSGTPHGAIANWHLAELSIRLAGSRPAGMDDARLRSLLEEARLNLVQARRWIDEMLARGPVQDDESSFPFMPVATYPGRNYYLAARMSIVRTVWLMDSCDVIGDMDSARIIGRWMSINPAMGDYASSLAKLLDDEAGKLAADVKPPAAINHLKLAIAMADPDMTRRVRALMSLSAIPTISGAGADLHACYELGMISLSAGEEGRKKMFLSPPEEYFKIVVMLPGNPWYGMANDLLASLQDGSIGGY